MHLLYKGQFLSENRLQDLLVAYLPYLEMRICNLQQGNLLEAIQEFLEWRYMLDTWDFVCGEWVILTRLGGKQIPFPPSVLSAHRLFSEVDASDTCSELSRKGNLDYTPLQWNNFWKRLWSASLHRRDLLFLRRIVQKGFFSVAMAALMSF
ncbi:hypothetical protein R1flu_021170 [Riccia fluitans]|uniref:Maturase K n=1 Tax=Riccia fluitans TaxID=41844 RepID=A0ABD1ZNL1_9MARC